MRFLIRISCLFCFFLVYVIKSVISTLASMFMKNLFSHGSIVIWSACRFLRRAQPRSRIMVSGWGIRVELVITTCTRSTVTPLWMVPLSRCTPRWLPATGFVTIASRSSKLLPSQPNYARERAPSSSTTPKSSSHWCTGRLGHQLGSWRPHTRPPGPTCLCNSPWLIVCQSYKREKGVRQS